MPHTHEQAPVLRNRPAHRQTALGCGAPQATARLRDIGEEGEALVCRHPLAKPTKSGEWLLGVRVDELLATRSAQ